MPSETLKTRILETLANLEGYFPQAEELADAVREGVSDAVLLELAELLCESAGVAKAEISKQAIESAASLIASGRAEEASERLLDHEAADAVLRFG